MASIQIRTPGTNWEGEILQKVSRSFALTIPQLPSGLRERVANAYLLCRILDTIEDEQCLSLQEKNDFFNEFLAVTEEKRPPGEFIGNLCPRLNCSAQPAEKELVSGSGAVFDRFFGFNPNQQSIIRRCLRIMASGMLRFQTIQSTDGLKDMAHLDGYCYCVAGVVGEMLTDLFCEYSSRIARHHHALFQKASSFGQGLQMTNILKDLWEDRDRGVCWLPRDIFKNAGIDVSNLKRGHYTYQFGDGLEKLIGIAHKHLRNAVQYTLFIPPSERDIRKFCLWVIGMALLTLKNIHQSRDYASGEQVKISRGDVKNVIITCGLTLRNDWLLWLAYRLASRGLPFDGDGTQTDDPLKLKHFIVGRD